MQLILRLTALCLLVYQKRLMPFGCQKPDAALKTSSRRNDDF
jgi:hypothetical protein